MSGWFFIKAGMLDDETIGPISDQELMQVAYEGMVKGETLIHHQQHTKGQWVKLERIAALKQRLEQGHADRQTQKAADAELRKQQKAQAKSEASQRKQAAVEEAAQRKANSPIRQLLMDGQSEEVVERIYQRAQEVLTAAEAIQYIAVQAKPVQVAPDAIILTNRRFIIYRQKILGQMEFADHLWRDLHDARVKEGIMFAEISMAATNGQVITIGYLPKAQARRIYRICQEREEEAIEERRRRSMEEQRAGASNVVVQSPASSQETPTAPQDDDPMAKLAKLKQMLDAGLIEQDEYDATKARILSSM